MIRPRLSLATGTEAVARLSTGRRVRTQAVALPRQGILWKYGKLSVSKEGVGIMVAPTRRAIPATLAVNAGWRGAFGRFRH